MRDLAIRVEGLGKRYRLGETSSGATFRELIRGSMKLPARLLQHRLRTRTSRWSTDEEGTNDVWALKDVSFEVNQGEVIGVIGRNGAGKSTLLKILTRITRPTTGRAEIHGRVGSLLEVGTGFHPELTGRENIFLNGAILGMRREEIKRKFDEIVDFSGVEKFLDTPVKRYSSGMRVRLAFAVAAHLDPEILLIDEVLAVGDAEFQKRCLGKMQDVAQGGRTVLFVSHNMAAIERLCNRVMRLDRGNIVDISSDTALIVQSHLRSAGSQFTSLPYCWKNQGGAFDNAWLKPERFSLETGDGSPMTGTVRNDDEIFVRVYADVLRLVADVTVGYSLFNADGIELYRSCITDVSQEDWIRLRVGKQCLQSRLPARLLNEGTYRLDLILKIPGGDWICCPGDTSPSVFLQIEGGLSDSPRWTKRRKGLLAPVLHWSTVDQSASTGSCEHEDAFS